MSAPCPEPKAAEPPSEAGETPRALWVITDAWDEAAIPMRPWIARGYLMRGALTILSGHGSAGKSSLMIAWACSLVLGSSFARMHAECERRVAIYNVEDDEHEQKRRFSAMAGKLGVPIKNFGGRLAILGPKGVGTLLTYGRDGMILLNTAVMDELDEFCEQFRPDVLIMDPFVELHSAEENDNTAIRAVMAYFRRLAIKYDCALVILHHPHKGTTTPGDPDSLRGASSIVGAGRVILTLAVMTEEESEKLTVPKERRRDYFRLDDAKINYARLEDAEWFHREERLLANGDTAVAVWPWRPASPFKDLTSEDLNMALDRIAEGFAPGQPFGSTRRGRSNDRWCGSVLMTMFGLAEEQARQIVASWLQSGLLVETKFHDPKEGRERSGVHVVDLRRPS